MNKILMAFMLLLAQNVSGQEDNFRQVLKTAIYHPKIYEKVFFEYMGDSGVTFLDGYKKGMMCAFMLPDSNIRKYHPNITYLVGTAHGKEKLFLTMTLLSHPQGKAFVTSHVMDPGIRLFIDFEQIDITKNHATLSFHTTSHDEKKSLKRNYVRVLCELRKRRKGWKVKNIKIEPFPCCTSLW